MDTNLQFIILPIVGALIGTITNELAIRMLFRPYTKKYFLKIPLPLTPGIIPKQQKIIAKNIAETFEAHLLNADDLAELLVSEKAQLVINQKVDNIFEQLGPLASFASTMKPKIIEYFNSAIKDLLQDNNWKQGTNIKQKIELKINAMNIATLEKLILGFSRKQFRHITLFGAFLGGIIGLIQAVIINI